MAESVENTGNSTVANGAPETTGAESTANTTLEGIMGGMASETSPEVKPATGEKTEGTTAQKPTELPAWTSQLNEELKTNEAVMKQLAKFGKLSDLAKSYTELEGKLGNSIVKPGENASDEEREAFYQKLGKPAAADKYSIDDENAAVFKDLAYKNNLTDDQAKGIYTAFQEIGKNALAQQQAAQAAQLKATEEALKAEWGKDYGAKITMLQRGVNAYGGKSLGDKLKASGLLFDADVVKMFVQLGEESSEAGITGKTAKGSSYTRTEDGGKFTWIEKQFKGN